MSRKHCLSILIQDTFDKALLSKILHSYDISFYAEIEEARVNINEQLPNLIIIDSHFSNSGFALCKNLLHNQKTQGIPILFIFDTIDRDGITTMFHSGAADYILKPFNQFEVVSRIDIHIKYAKQKQKLEFLANYDPMTQTYNRRTFFKQAEQAIIYSRKKKITLHLILFHFDTLFAINEEYGHFTGDKILQEFSHILTDSFNAEGIIGRLDGNNFAVVLTGNPEETTTSLTSSIIDKSNEITVDGAKPVKIVSATTYLYNPDESIDDLLLEASMQIEACQIARKTRNY